MPPATHIRLHPNPNPSLILTPTPTLTLTLTLTPNPNPNPPRWTCLLTSAVSTPRNRGRAHRWLIGLAKRGDHQQEAATIAALVSGSRASDVLSEGAERFRAIRLDAISTNG